MDTTYDVAVIGGGPAGLQAALTLGRMHHRVLLLDSGSYRNDPADQMHNVITHDGRPPAEFRELAHAELATYETVELRSAEVTSVAPDGDGFALHIHGGGIVTAGRLVLATGVRDTVPDLPGLADLFGTVAAHCPYCHGHEFAGRHVVILGSHPHVPLVAALLERIAGRRTVLTDGVDLEPDTARLLELSGVAVRTDPVTSFAAHGDGALVSFESGQPIEAGGIMIATTFVPSGPFVEQLGLATLPSGCVEIDVRGRTTVPGVYAAGDLAHVAELPMPMSAVVTAAASGLVAATTIDADLIVARHAGLLATV